jgi:flagellar basal-body rod protein FlgF
MDKMIHTALNSIKNLQDVRFTSSQNLSNSTVPGFRKDLPNEGGVAFIEAMKQASARAMSLETGPHLFSDQQGALNDTGVETDVAIVSEGYFFVQPKFGDPALSRRGDFSVTADGTLVNGAGDQVLNNNLEPIVLPAFSEIQFSELGEILISPLDAPPGQFQAAGQIGSTLATEADLIKGKDGHIRLADGTLPPADQGARIAQGVLEASNVDTVEELVQSLEAQRQFELGVKFIKMAEDIDRGGAELMRLPQN